MRRCARNWAILAGSMLIWVAPAHAEPVSEGYPHKWETVEQGMADFLAQGFELRSVVYEEARKDLNPDQPDVHYFLQKGKQLVRCDFRRRQETSYYYCARLVPPHGK